MKNDDYNHYHGVTRNKSLVLFILTMIFFLLLGCSFSTPFSLFKPTETSTATSTFTPSSTSTPTATRTARPTRTSSVTPTPVPPRFSVEIQSDESTLVTDVVCGFQFVLPKGWQPSSDLENYTDLGTSFASVAVHSTISPALRIFIRSFKPKMSTLEQELLIYSSELNREPFKSILSQAIITNPYGTKLGVLRVSKLGYIPGTIKNKAKARPLVGANYHESYEILFYCGDEVINIRIGGREGMFMAYMLNNTELQLIYAVQNSIRLK